MHSNAGARRRPEADSGAQRVLLANSGVHNARVRGYSTCVHVIDPGPSSSGPLGKVDKALMIFRLATAKWVTFLQVILVAVLYVGRFGSDSLPT